MAYEYLAWKKGSKYSNSGNKKEEPLSCRDELGQYVPVVEAYYVWIKMLNEFTNHFKLEYRLDGISC